MDDWGGGYWSNRGGSDPGDENEEQADGVGAWDAERIPREPPPEPGPEPDYRELAKRYRPAHDCGFCNALAAVYCMKCEGRLDG